MRISRLPPEERRRRKRGIQPVAWAFVAMAAGFGAVAAYVVFSSPPAESHDPGRGGRGSTNQRAAMAGHGPLPSGDPTATGTTVVLDPVERRREIAAALESAAAAAGGRAVDDPELLAEVEKIREIQAGQHD